MIASLLIPICIGFAIVLQGGLLKRMSGGWGLASATLFNNVIVVLVGVVLLIAVKIWPIVFPEAFRGQAGAVRWQWWYVIPGICGFIVVVGIPYAFLRIGALRVMVLLIASQIVGGALWDLFAEGRSITPARAAGALITLAGAVLTAWKG